MAIISIANFSNSDHFLLLFSQPLDCRYQIQFYSTTGSRRQAVAACSEVVDEAADGLW